jgi:DNA-binding phage protein
MDKNIVKDLDKYYSLAKKIAGELGNDLLHHVLINFENKRELTGVELTKYVTTVLKNEFRNPKSTFNRLYNFVEINPECEQTKYYDTNQLNKILDELINEGHEDKVNFFRDMLYNKITVKEIAEEMGVSRKYIYKNFLNFVKNEIKIRYVHDEY